MLRLTTAIILILAFAIQTFYTGGLVADYYLNTSQYLKNCVNKAKPVLKCSGKCQLAKKIQQQQEREQTAPERKSEIKIQLLCFRPYFAAAATNQPIIVVPIIPYQEYHLRTGYPRAVFQPPSLV